MTEARWNEIDRYFNALLVPQDAGLDAALAASEAASLPPINVAPNQGKLLHLLARMCGARRILEMGTLGGYSTIWLARALPTDGSLVTLEADLHHAKVARGNLANAGVGHLVDVRVGPALDSLPRIEEEGLGGFDFIFIDADKPNNPAYFRWALRLSHVGTVIVVDNVVRGGAMANAGSSDPNVRGVREMTEQIAQEPRVAATVIQTVGSKGYDGFLLALVTSTPEGFGAAPDVNVPSRDEWNRA